MKLIPVLVTTITGSIFFGYSTSLGRTPKNRKKLARARHCYSYEAPNDDHQKGTYSLATVGPQPGSRIGPAVPSIVIHGVSNIVECTTEAADAWETSKWGR